MYRGHQMRFFAGVLTSIALFCHSVANAEDGVSERQLLIGQTISLQDGKNDYGVAVLDGVNAALAQANAAGGVNGRQVVLKVMDNANQAARAEADARTLVSQDKVFILFGPIEGGPSTAVMKAAVELKVPLFGPMAGSPELRAPHQPLVFPVRAEHKDEFKALITYARSLGMQRMAFVRSNSSTGEMHLQNVKALATEIGMELVADLPFSSDIDTAGIDAMAQTLGKSGAQMVLNHGSPGMYEKLIRRTVALGVKTHFYGVNSGSSQLADHLGDLAHTMIFAQVMPSPWERKTAITRAYQVALGRFSPGKDFSYGSLEGYLTARALIEALKRAGRNPTRASFLAGLRNSELSIEDIRVNYDDKRHTGMKLVDLTIVTRNGRFRH